jgi:hypothetical protein
MSRFYFIPDDYEPTAKTLERARSLGLSDKQITDELEKCRDYQYKRPMIDPDRCFRNWLRNAIKFGEVVPATVREYRRPEELSDDQRRADAAKAWRDLNRLKGA